MIKVAKHKLRTNKEGLDRLHECNRVSAMIWNACLEHAREHHIETGEWINKADLQSALKKSFRYIANVYRQWLINICLHGQERAPHAKKGIIRDIPIEAKMYFRPNGKKMVSRLEKTAKSSYLWAYGRGSDKNLS